MPKQTIENKVNTFLAFCFLILSNINGIYCNAACPISNTRLFDKTAPYVTSTQRGQLGNQLFQAAAGISLATDNNARYIHPLAHKHHYPEVFGPFIHSLPKHPEFHFKNRGKNGYDNTFSFHPIPYKNNMQIDGFFQSYKYFHHNQDVICKIFSPSKARKTSTLKKYGKVLNENITVGLHIRTFYPDVKSRSDSECNRFYSRCPPPNMHYIKTAIDYFPPEVLFIVCSDNIEWAKKALKHIDRKIIFSDGSDLYEDFYLLTMCNHLIISSSTYSWWAAYLNQNKNKIIIAPNNTLLFDSQRKIEDTYPPDWILINRVEDKRIPVFEGESIFR